MKQNRITNILLAGFILAALIVCGVIGYMNDSGRVSPYPTQTEDASPTAASAEINLGYCSNLESLCVMSFSSDSVGNLLIAIKNKTPELAEFYAKINQPGVSNLYPCQKVKFTPEVYYCFGDPIANADMATMEIYSKDDDQLIASGSLQVHIGATPAPLPTEAPAATAEEVSTEAISTPATQPATATP
jgi:hypothetical protein